MWTIAGGCEDIIRNAWAIVNVLDLISNYIGKWKLCMSALQDWNQSKSRHF